MKQKTLWEQRGISARRIGRKVSYAGFIGLLIAVALILTALNWGRDDFARTVGLGGLFLYWWAAASVLGVGSFIFGLQSAKPTPLLDFIGVFAIASTVGVAVAATDFSAGRLGPVTLTLPLLFPLARYLSVKLRVGRSRQQAAQTSITSHGGEK